MLITHHMLEEIKQYIYFSKSSYDLYTRAGYKYTYCTRRAPRLKRVFFLCKN